MPKNQPQQPDSSQRAHVGEPEGNDRCLVCGRVTQGKAICSDPNCAAELAQG